MEDSLERAFAAAKMDWPSFGQPTFEEYSQHIRQLGVGTAELDLYAADLYLALACALSDVEALRAFEKTYLPRLEENLARSGFEKATRQDVLQQVLLHLCVGEQPRFLTYAARASLNSWLSVTTLRFALNMYPRKSTRNSSGHELSLEQLGVDRDNPEIQVSIEKARPAFQAALQTAICSLPERDRTLLRLCFLDGLSIDVIGGMYGVHRATAARWIAAVRQRILREVQVMVARDLGLNVSEFDSLAFLVRSQLHLSISRVLGAA